MPCGVNREMRKEKVRIMGAHILYMLVYELPRFVTLPRTISLVVDFQGVRVYLWYGMLQYGMVCSGMLCYVMLCCVMSCYVVYFMNVMYVIYVM